MNIFTLKTIARGYLIHSDSSSGKRTKILQDMAICVDKEESIAFQPPMQSHEVVSFCSYYCKSYEMSFGSTGIIFESDSPVVYA